MYIICQKYNDEVAGICRELDYMENGYPRDVHRNTAYVKETVQVYENVEVPEGVAERKYCYTPQKGFYENPAYREPEGGLEERVKELEDALAALTAGAEAAAGGEAHA